MQFAFDEGKNEQLFRHRGVTFGIAIEAIVEKGVLLNFDHPNQNKYPGQKVLVVDIDGYAYCFPYVIDGDMWVLKTVYPSRKFKHLVQGGDDE